MVAVHDISVKDEKGVKGGCIIPEYGMFLRAA